MALMFATNSRARLSSVGLSTATLLNLLGLPLGEVTITAATYQILTTDSFVYVSRAGIVTLTLPDAAAWLAEDAHGAPFQLIIQDVSGAAFTNNITINRAGSDTVNGLTSITITSDYGGYKLRPAASGLWVIQ